MSCKWNVDYIALCVCSLTLKIELNFHFIKNITWKYYFQRWLNDNCFCMLHQDSLCIVLHTGADPNITGSVSEQNCVTDSAKVRKAGMSQHTNRTSGAEKDEKPSHFRERGRVKINNNFHHWHFLMRPYPHHHTRKKKSQISVVTQLFLLDRNGEQMKTCV